MPQPLMEVCAENTNGVRSENTNGTQTQTTNKPPLLEADLDTSEKSPAGELMNVDHETNTTESNNVVEEKMKSEDVLPMEVDECEDTPNPLVARVF